MKSSSNKFIASLIQINEETIKSNNLVNIWNQEVF
jgi:hypothetical protein